MNLDSLRGIVRPFVAIVGFTAFTAIVFLAALSGGIEWRTAIEIYSAPTVGFISYYFGKRDQAGGNS